ncbi:MAG: hypothetical protein ACYS7Y_25055 [Planctomycetota bacterium]|jgi:hypothetical protein
MHAAFPRFSREINQIMQLGAVNSTVSELMDRAGGRFLAEGMAKLLKLGFGFLMLDSVFSRHQPEKAETFFNDNFVITDSTAPGGKRYYQGKFMIRTKKPDDDMNVLLKFCPQPGKLYKETALGTFLDPSSVVTTETLNENQADRIEKDPDQVDLVIRFKDVKSIKGLLKQPDVDMAGMLLDNVVQLTGNLGHLFKLGAIAQNVKREIDLPRL